jgi:hypothetical protein
MAQSDSLSNQSRMITSPRSGVSLLFSEHTEPAFLQQARCVSPTLEDWDIFAKTNAPQIRQVDTYMDLTKLDDGGDDNIVQSDRQSNAPTPTRPTCSGVANGIQIPSVDGQTSKIRLGASGTRPVSLREILRTTGALQLSSHIFRPDDNATGLSNAFLSNNCHTNKMTSHVLQMNESKLFLNGAHALESRVPPRACSARRHRSRAIAIKRMSRDEKPQEIRESSAAAEYDWATWRMYNRIIDYRQKFPVNYRHEDASPESSLPTLNLRLNDLAANARELRDPSSAGLSTYDLHDYPEYGEIFDLDM